MNAGVAGIKNSESRIQIQALEQNVEDFGVQYVHACEPMSKV
jgi:hypothetical protein